MHRKCSLGLMGGTSNSFKYGKDHGTDGEGGAHAYYYLQIYSTRTLMRIIWEIVCMCTISILELIPHMRSFIIIHTIGLCFSFFDPTLFVGVRQIGHGATSRWAILPPSNETFILYAAHRFCTLRFYK